MIASVLVGSTYPISHPYHMVVSTGMSVSLLPSQNLSQLPSSSAWWSTTGPFQARSSSQVIN